ncbi:MAG: hypothetical protein ACRCX4_12390 [Bacteroidales bacterium]
MKPLFFVYSNTIAFRMLLRMWKRGGPIGKALNFICLPLSTTRSRLFIEAFPSSIFIISKKKEAADIVITVRAVILYLQNIRWAKALAKNKHADKFAGTR